MRRAFLLAVIAAPALAIGQTVASGAVQFSDGTNDLLHGGLINLAECQGQPTTPGDTTTVPKVNLSWNTAFSANPTATTFNYTVYAANKESTTAPNCLDAPVPNDATQAGSVGQTLNNAAKSVNLQAFPTSVFVTAAGYDCTTQAERTIYVCVQAFDGATKVGWAKGTLTLSVSKPGAPTGVNAKPADDGALEVSWTAPDTATLAYEYRITATATGDTSNHETFVTQSTTKIVPGLTNDVPYTISVWARSKAGNESDTAGTASATPRNVLNYWDLYHDVYQGQEQGGCSSGAAGPIALLGITALVTRLRRRS